ncbi:MAG: carboxypeptidase regulatory-like domain-containing protein [Candidatus Acidiferrales bacterium]
MNLRRILVVAFALLAVGFVASQTAWSQATVGTGSIQGVVTDPQGAVVQGATISITNRDTGQVIQVTANSSGAFSTGALIPGNYSIRVQAANFKTTETTVVVQVGQITSGNTRLELGAASSIVEVTSQAVTVDLDQAQVSGTLTAQQIENLPVNGRNFLDLAQLEPGVQIQDGSNFDPTKTGFSSISFGGRFGRTARIEIDGLDVSDETVGTTTTSIPESAIQEFQIAQSTLDLSTELTSSGAVNVTTKSGTNTIHGQAFGFFRDSTQGAALPGGADYQRNQDGASVGGAIIKDKLFFFGDGEHTEQHAGAGVILPPPFTSFDGTFSSPFRETNLLGRVDFQATQNLHLFFRYNYFQNGLVPSFGTPGYSFFGNKDRTRNFAAGADFTTGSLTHSIRFEYLKFVNNIGDAVRGSGAPLSELPVSLDFLSSGLNTGPSPDAPQYTLQRNLQFKYDGSRILGSHIIRYGAAYNRILGGGYASFFGISPLVEDAQYTGDPYDSYVGALVTCPGGQTDVSCPLNYTPDVAIIGNGLGYSSEKPGFGYPFGGQGPDNRLGLYIGDSWKVRPNLTFLYGVRYVRDTGRTDSDLNTLGVVNEYLPGFGDPVTQQNRNFGPQIGLAWDPTGSGKTVIRSGIGLYYENAIWNNVLFDRPARLPSGAFLSYETACINGTGTPVPFADGSSQVIPGGNSTCTSAIGATLPASAVSPLLSCSGITTAQCIANFQGAFQASAAAHPTSANAAYLPNQIAAGQALTGGAGTFAPNYEVPRSVQMNVGVQHQISPGMVITGDYVRNVATHYLLNIDENHTGDAAYLNVPAAQQAVASTLAACGVGSINAAIAACPGLHPAVPPSGGNPGTPVGPATIADFASNGLDSPNDIAGGAECGGPAASQSGVTFPCAFGGINPLIGEAPFLEPVGRSVYNAMDIKWVENKSNPFTGVRYLNFQFSYTLSRFQNSGTGSAGGGPSSGDQDFINNALDNRNPLRYMGDSTLDRTNQFNFGGFARLPGGFQLGLTAHFWSPLAVTPSVSLAGTAAIFESDFTGDGTVSDPLPKAQTSSSCGTAGGTCTYTTYNTGSFGRSLGPASLQNAITSYNTNIAGTGIAGPGNVSGSITPAGQALINAGLMTQAQLQQLGATAQPLAGVVPGQASLAWMRTTDLQISWTGKLLHERLSVTPSVALYNVFNFANFDSPASILAGSLATYSSSQPIGTDGTISGTVGDSTRFDRIGTGTGVFGLGSPRAIEWGLKLDF